VPSAQVHTGMSTIPYQPMPRVIGMGERNPWDGGYFQVVMNKNLTTLSPTTVMHRNVCGQLWCFFSVENHALHFQLTFLGYLCTDGSKCYECDHILTSRNNKANYVGRVSLRVLAKRQTNWLSIRCDCRNDYYLQIHGTRR